MGFKRAFARRCLYPQTLAYAARLCRKVNLCLKVANVLNDRIAEDDGIGLISKPEATAISLHDPDAVIGADFQATLIVTTNDDLITGLVRAETSSAVTLQTITGVTVVPKAGIAQRTRSEKSLMPEGLLDSLNDREQIELLKYLISH